MSSQKKLNLFSLKTASLRVSFAFCLLFFSNQIFSQTELVVQNGELDLRLWQPSHVLRVEGSWEVYWKRLHRPKDFSNLKIKHRKITAVPGTWNSPFGTGIGYGTYRVSVKLNDHQKNLSLFIPEILSSWKLWVNGKLVGQQGVVSKRAVRAKATRKGQVVFLPNHNNQLEFILQVANHHHHRGGLITAPLIGSREAIQKHIDIDQSTLTFILGGLIVIAIYHLMIYFLRSQTTSTVYFGLVCLTLAMRALMVDDSFSYFDALKENFELSYKLEYLGFSVSVALYALFCQEMFGRQFYRPITIYTLVLSPGEKNTFKITFSDLFARAGVVDMHAMFVLSRSLLFKDDQYFVILDKSKLSDGKAIPHPPIESH